MLERIHWLGHDAFRIDGPPTVYFDPYELSSPQPKADLILITHDHGDHCSPADVAKIQDAATIIVTISAAATKLGGNIQIVKPGDRIAAKGKSGHVGFVITIDGQRIYHAGDTDHIPEMAQLGEIDIALLPVSGLYAMTADEAAEAAGTIRPKIAVPMHVGRGIGSTESVHTFNEKAPVQVVILEIEQEDLGG